LGSFNKSSVIASENGYFDIVKLLIEANASINHQDKWKWSALEYGW
jgi:hypothetical protein